MNRVELKNIMPPAAIQEAMEKQMKAERERRESILIAEGEKKSTILVAEGKKESAILDAEAEKNRGDPAGGSGEGKDDQRGGRPGGSDPEGAAGQRGRYPFPERGGGRRVCADAEKSGSAWHAGQRQCYQDRSSFGPAGTGRTGNLSERNHKRVIRSEFIKVIQWRNTSCDTGSVSM